MTEPRCYLSPDCVHGPHAADEHPCGQGNEPPGTPCRYCGALTPLDGEPCPACWKPMTVADFKAFAAEHGWDTNRVSGAT